MDSMRLVKNRKKLEGMEIVRKFLVAATFEKAKTYVFAEMIIHNPKVEGSFRPSLLGISRMKRDRLCSQKQDKPLHAVRFLERIGTYSGK
jgi:hypothetical protein